MAVINALDPVIARVFAEKGEPVVVMSGQMGMVTYHITQRHFGRIRFVDRHGLVERSLTDCAFTRDSSKDTNGLVMTTTQYLRATATSSGCELPRPDVIFDIGTFVQSDVGAYSYAEVFRQSGAINAVGILPKSTVLANAYIAVDSQRYPAIRPFGAARPTER